MSSLSRHHHHHVSDAVPHEHDHHPIIQRSENCWRYLKSVKIWAQPYPQGPPIVAFLRAKSTGVLLILRRHDVIWKKKNAFWCRIGFIWHHNRQKQYVLRFSLSASATPVSNCIRTGQWSNSFWDNTRQRGVVLFGLILRRHYKQFISLEF